MGEKQTEKRDRFPASYDWHRFMLRMSDEQCGRFWRAIYDYQLNGVIYDGDDPVVGIAFDGALPFMQACKDHYEEVCRKNAANGKKGGRPRKKKTQDASGDKNPTVISVSENTPEQQPKKPRKADYDYDYDYDIDYESPLPPLTGGAGDNSADAAPAFYSEKLAKIVRYYQAKISPDISRPVVEELKRSSEQWDSEVVLSAIDKAIDSGKRSGSYVCGILRGYRKDGVHSIYDVQRSDEAFRASREQEKAQRQIRQARNTPAGSAGYLPQDDLAYLFENPPETPQEAV